MPSAAIPSQAGGELQYGAITVDLKFTATTDGAVPSTLTRATGITSITKSSDDYIVLFDSAYVDLLESNIVVIQASYNASTGACIGKVTAVSIDDSTPTVTMSFYNAAGTAVALAINDVVRATFRVVTMKQAWES